MDIEKMDGQLIVIVKIHARYNATYNWKVLFQPYLIDLGRNVLLVYIKFLHFKETKI